MSINQRQYTGYPAPQSLLMGKIPATPSQSYDLNTNAQPQQNYQPAAQFDTAPVGNDIMQALMSMLQMMMTMLGSLAKGKAGQTHQDSTDSPDDSIGSNDETGQSGGCSGKAGGHRTEDSEQHLSPTEKTTSTSKKSAGTTTSSKSIDWGAPASVSEDPNGAYQVPGGFQPPKGNEKADAAPGITADPGNIQDANAAPDDSKSHSQAAGTKERHSMAQVEQMYGDIVDEKLAKYNAKYGTDCPREVILGIIYQESQGDPNTFGTDDPAESRGLMQVTADNAAREFPGKNQYNPEVSIETGVEAYTRTLKQYNGNHMQALASYNQGKPTTDQGKAYAQWIKLWAEQVP